MAEGGVAAQGWVPGNNLDPNARKARYGVLFVRTVASQAGWSTKETSPDEDREAIDLTLEFCDGLVYVQVKCGTRALGERGIRQPISPAWVKHWNRKPFPVYLVYVSVPNEPSGWIAHSVRATLHRSHAYWRRVDQRVKGANVTIPRHNRLTADTLAGWRDDFLAMYSRDEA